MYLQVFRFSPQISRRNLPVYLARQKLFSSSSNSAVLTDDELKNLDAWTVSHQTVTSHDPLTAEQVHDLFITMPTRDGGRLPFEAPVAGQPLPHGYHLPFFHAKRPSYELREDGTENDHSPPSPFLTRMWVGGSMTWNNELPLKIGIKTKASSRVQDTKMRGVEAGNPKLFARKAIQYVQEGQTVPSLTEERTHVYLHSGIYAKAAKIFDRPVQVPNGPIAFSFKFSTSPVSLFRYSAIMFNAHLIHYDPEYSQKVEGYPERLVHGPLTAQMLLDVTKLQMPGLALRSFDYRATNPFFVNQEATIFGHINESEDMVEVWCQDNASKAVVMTGKVHYTADESNLEVKSL
ncbi:hypothetical protein CPB83DRAFT_806774 [Crepidotus variabilis]|uniref:Uncharacterized protein n=1 Tax=Crepidotus variabilis TaxID=179855 RepID=A0A9P6EPJ0_9AGAR|nr:hypothetical protein CPB83DRAFT_806774 [Crepidotus variabilis]